MHARLLQDACQAKTSGYHTNLQRLSTLTLHSRILLIHHLLLFALVGLRTYSEISTALISSQNLWDGSFLYLEYSFPDTLLYVDFCPQSTLEAHPTSVKTILFSNSVCLMFQSLFGAPHAVDDFKSFTVHC